MKWAVFGVLAAITFAFLDLFEKLSSFQDPFYSGIIIFAVSTALFVPFALRLKNEKINVYYFLLSGVFSGIGNLFILYTLLNNFLIVVAPFIPAAGMVFFAELYIIERPKYSTQKLLLAIAGLILTVVGSFFIATTAEGLSPSMAFSTFSVEYLIPVIIIVVALGNVAYFFYRGTRGVKQPFVGSMLYCFSALLTVVAGTLILQPTLLLSIGKLSELGYLYPILGGTALFFGTFLGFLGFNAAGHENKMKETITTILYNSDILPLIPLTYFILGENIIDGVLLFWVFAMFLGLVMLNFSENQY